jgi:hypothetical protein
MPTTLVCLNVVHTGPTEPTGHYGWLAGAPDTTYRLITTYPAQLQRTYVSHLIIANCKLKLILARLPSSSIHTGRPGAAHSNDLPVKYTFYILQFAVPDSACEKNAIPPPRVTHPPTLDLTQHRYHRNADPWEACGVGAWSREVKTCSNNLPCLFSSPAVVIVFEVSWFGHGRRLADWQGMIQLVIG